jgi:hypothetical protein
VTLVDFDPDAEDKLVARCSTPQPPARDQQLARGCAHVGRRAPRGGAGLRRRARQPPPQARAGPSSGSTTASTCWPTTAPSATCSATDAHDRVATLTPEPRLHPPEAVDDAGPPTCSTRRWTAVGRSARRAAPDFPEQAATPCRWPTGALRDAVQRPRGDAPARAAHHAPGPPAYRRVGQEMHRLIAEQAGHHAVAEAMTHVDHEEPELERL